MIVSKAALLKTRRPNVAMVAPASIGKQEVRPNIDYVTYANASVDIKEQVKKLFPRATSDPTIEIHCACQEGRLLGAA